MFRKIPFEMFQVASDSSSFSGVDDSYELHPKWYSVLLKYIKRKGDTVFYYGLYDSESLLMAMPLIHRRALARKSLVPVANYYTSLFRPSTLLTDSALENSYQQFLKGIMSACDWDDLWLGPMDKDGSSFEAAEAALRSLGIPYKPYFWFENLTMDVEENSEAYLLSKVSSQIKNTVKRKSSQINKNHCVQFRVIEGGDELSRALSDFHRVYQSSWKKPEGIPEFISEFCVEAANMGWLRIAELEVDGRVAASQVWFIKSGVASIFKLAHDENYKRYSVGSILTYEMMKHVVVDECVSKIDYLIGGDSYKKEWGFKSRARWGIVAFNRERIAGSLLSFRHVLLPRLLNFFYGK